MASVTQVGFRFVFPFVARGQIEINVEAKRSFGLFFAYVCLPVISGKRRCPKFGLSRESLLAPVQRLFQRKASLPEKAKSSDKIENMTAGTPIFGASSDVQKSEIWGYFPSKENLKNIENTIIINMLPGLVLSSERQHRV